MIYTHDTWIHARVNERDRSHPTRGTLSHTGDVTPRKSPRRQKQSQMDPAANGSGFTAAPTATQNGKNSEETNSEFTEPRHLGAFHDDENDQTARLLHDRKRLMWCVVYFLSCSLLHEAVGHIHLSQLAVPGGRPRRSHLHLHHHRPSGQMPGGPALPGQLQAHEAEGDRRRQPV